MCFTQLETQLETLAKWDTARYPELPTDIVDHWIVQNPLLCVITLQLALLCGLFLFFT